MKKPLCVIHGRFQLPHKGHLSGLVLPAFDYAERVIIGICNPEPDLTAFEEANPHRSSDDANPFTFWERLEMYRVMLASEGIPHDRYDIVPFPINFPNKIPNYAPKNADYLLTIYDEWGKKKKTDLEAQGFNVVVIKEMTLETRGVSGSEIRDMIKNNDNSWKNHVHEAVQKYLADNNLLERIK